MNKIKISKNTQETNSLDRNLAFNYCIYIQILAVVRQEQICQFLKLRYFCVLNGEPLKMKPGNRFTRSDDFDWFAVARRGSCLW